MLLSMTRAQRAVSNGMGLALAAFSGVLLGGMFFGGLWWTIRRGIVSTAPALWFFGSLLIRTAAALGGFYAVSQGEWRRLVACLLGFLLARFAVMRKSGTVGALPSSMLRAAP
jgi:F1F0 ATPase subunit 2